MPKTQPKNSFYFYMKELQEEYKSKGLNYTMRQMPELATPTWRSMNAAARAPYEEEAKNASLTHKDRIGKLDCTGQSITENIRITKSEMRAQVEEQNYIENIWDHLKSENEVAKHVFYFISTQSFGKTSEGFYMPAEIALAKYSIHEGIMEEFHSFINPGSPPLGYRFEMQDTSDRTHKIPISGFDLAKDSYGDIVEGIYKVVQNQGSLDTNPVLFCYSEELKQTDFILNDLLMKALDRPRQRRFRIYDITTLMCSLYGRFRSFSKGIIEDKWLKSDKFAFMDNTCCRYHWDNEVSYCALGNVKRFCYVFSDYLCELFNVDIIRGKHLPSSEDRYSEINSKDPYENLSYSTLSNGRVKERSTGNIENKTSLACSARDSVWKMPEQFISQKPADFPNTIPLNNDFEQLNLDSEKVYKNKTFASAAMGQSQNQTQFELTDDNFPDLSSSIYPPSSSIEINIPGWQSRSSSNVSALTNSDALAPRVLGRGRFMKKAQ